MKKIKIYEVYDGSVYLSDGRTTYHQAAKDTDQLMYNLANYDDLVSNRDMMPYVPEMLIALEASGIIVLVGTVINDYLYPEDQSDCNPIPRNRYIN